MGNLYLKFILCSDCWDGKPCTYLFVVLAVPNFPVVCFLLEERVEKENCRRLQDRALSARPTNFFFLTF